MLGHSPDPFCLCLSFHEKLLSYGQRKEVKSVSHSVMSDSVTTWTVTHQAPLSMEFSRQEHWGGLPFPSFRGSSWPRDWIWLSCIAGRSLPSEPPGKGKKHQETKRKFLVLKREYQIISLKGETRWEVYLWKSSFINHNSF